MSLELSVRQSNTVEERKIGILSLSAIPDDPRVRRQGDLFAQHGWAVIAVGLTGASSPRPAWTCLEANARDFGQRREAAGQALHRARRLADLSLLIVKPGHARSMSGRIDRHAEPLYCLAREHKADIWLANDWTALPIARRLADEQGVPYAYDTHELAVDEYAQSLRWRLTQRPIIAAIEGEGIAGAAVTSCVSQGIADRLHNLYGLTKKPLLIRNMPHYEACAYRPCGATIDVLYHGVVNVGRGLEACIDSVALWRPEFRLTIRGPGPVDYLAALSDRIRFGALSERVTLAPPVPMTDLVREATQFDVGLFALPDYSEQNVHVLPNKFFEYVMAGLALCVSDLPEMANLLRQYDLGRLIPNLTPQAIAATINRFDRASINAHKQNALVVAKTLNWDAEADRLFSAITKAVRLAVRAPASHRRGEPPFGPVH